MRAGDLPFPPTDLNILLVNLIVFIQCVLVVFVLVLGVCALQKKGQSKTLLIWMVKTLLTLISFIGFTFVTAPVALTESPEAENNQPLPPLLADGTTAPELSLRPPTGSAAGYSLQPEAGTSTGLSFEVPGVGDFVDVENISDGIQRQLKNIWDKEQRYIKNEIFPIFSGGTKEGYQALLKAEIQLFMQERFPDGNPTALMDFKEDLARDRSDSEAYRAFKQGLPRMK